jgi:hypothetical protein
MAHAFLWVIRSKQKEYRFLDGKMGYFYTAERTAPKNKRHLTEIHYRVKIFGKKKEAWDYFYKKNRAGVDMSNCAVVRKKVYLYTGSERKKYGWFDYWKNDKAFS